jgi:hypothetical protein
LDFRGIAKLPAASGILFRTFAENRRKMKIQYKINAIVKTKDVIDVFKSSGINRPVEDPERIA